MYLLIITLMTTVGISHPVVLYGNTPLYESYGECQKAGEQVQDWLTQDFVKVLYDCRRVQP